MGKIPHTVIIILSLLQKDGIMFKKNEIAKVRMGLHNRPCRVRIVDVVGDDAMVEQNNGTISIVDVNELLPILEGNEKNLRRRRTSERRA